MDADPTSLPSVTIKLTFLLYNNPFSQEIQDTSYIFCVNITFSGMYCLLITILAKGFQYTTNFFLTAMITNSPIWLIAVFIIFIGVLCATTNAFSGFLTYYIINFIRDMYEKQHPELRQNNNYKE